MKTVALVALLVLSFTTVYSQSTKTREARLLEDVEESIAKTRQRIDETANVLQGLQARFSDEHIDVKSAKDKLQILNDDLLPLLTRRRDLQLLKLQMSLPNNQIDLLKILIIQNERILDLLTNKFPQR